MPSRKRADGTGVAPSRGSFQASSFHPPPPPRPAGLAFLHSIPPPTVPRLLRLSAKLSVADARDRKFARALKGAPSVLALRRHVRPHENNAHRWQGHENTRRVVPQRIGVQEHARLQRTRTSAVSPLCTPAHPPTSTHHPTAPHSARCTPSRRGPRPPPPSGARTSPSRRRRRRRRRPRAARTCP